MNLPRLGYLSCASVLHRPSHSLQHLLRWTGQSYQLGSNAILNYTGLFHTMDVVQEGSKSTFYHFLFCANHHGL
jgi:hypothetical protein